MIIGGLGAQVDQRHRLIGERAHGDHSEQHVQLHWYPGSAKAHPLSSHGYELVSIYHKNTVCSRQFEAQDTCEAYGVRE
jgi:hypothetical protein